MYKLLLYPCDQRFKPLILRLKKGIFCCNLGDLYRDIDLHALGLPTRCITPYSIRLLKRWLKIARENNLGFTLCISYRKNYGKKKVKSV